MKRSLRTALPWHMTPVIFALAWPTMLEELMQTAVQYVDTAMVGAIGTQATAAVGATSTINWLVTCTISAVGVGFLAFVAQAFGSEDTERARRASAQAVLAALFCGVLFTALPLSLAGVVPRWMQVDPAIQELASQYFFVLYSPMLFRSAMIIFGVVLKAVGETRLPMKVGLMVNGINIVLNCLLIFPTGTLHFFGISVPGAGLGAVGAAIASAIAFSCGGIRMTVAFFRHPMISPRGCSFKPDLSILRPCFKVAAPNILQRFGTCLGYVAFAAMINSLGEVATAAHTIANTVESAFYVPGYGMQTAAATLAGNALGARDYQRIRDLSRMILVIEFCLMLVTGGLLFLFAPNMMRLFSRDLEVILLGSVVLRMVAVSEPFYGVSIIVEGMMQGMGKTMMPFLCNLLGMWGVRIVGTFVCTQFLGMGLVAAWGCMIFHNVLLFVMFYYYYRSGRWLPQEVRGQVLGRI